MVALALCTAPGSAPSAMATAYYELGDVLFAGVVGFLLALTLVFRQE